VTFSLLVCDTGNRGAGSSPEARRGAKRGLYAALRLSGTVDKAPLRRVSAPTVGLCAQRDVVSCETWRLATRVYGPPVSASGALDLVTCPKRERARGASPRPSPSGDGPRARSRVPPCSAASAQHIVAGLAPAGGERAARAKAATICWRDAAPPASTLAGSARRASTTRGACQPPCPEGAPQAGVDRRRALCQRRAPQVCERAPVAPGACRMLVNPLAPKGRRRRGLTSMWYVPGATGAHIRGGCWAG